MDEYFVPFFKKMEEAADFWKAGNKVKAYLTYKEASQWFTPTIVATIPTQLTNAIYNIEAATDRKQEHLMEVLASQHQHLVEEGKKAIAKANYLEATIPLQAAIDMTLAAPIALGDDTAARLLKKAQFGLEVQRGDAYLDVLLFESALKHYLVAQEIEQSVALNNKIQETIDQLHLQNLQIGQTHFSQGEFLKAEKVLLEAVAQKPNSSVLPKMIGHCYSALSKRYGAIQSDLTPKGVDAQLTPERIVAPDQSVRQLIRKAVSHKKYDEAVAQGNEYLAQEDLRKALLLFRDAQLYVPTKSNKHTINNLENYFYYLAKGENALRQKNPDALYFLESAQQLFDTAVARQLLQQARKKFKQKKVHRPNFFSSN